MINKEIVTLAHGDGGLLTKELIEKVFLSAFKGKELTSLGDAALLPQIEGALAFTTDSFVVNPLFFPGGDIGKLAVAGTVNDLAVSGAQPLYLTVGFIIEEGFPFKDLKKIALSMAKEAEKAGVRIVAGDTKVVEKDKGDGVYINTAGVGVIKGCVSKYENIKPGDLVLINGDIGLHGLAILSKRQGIEFESLVESDCASLNSLINGLRDKFSHKVKFMRDPTRGGLATTLKEMAESAKVSIELREELLPIPDAVKGGCEFLGLDPLYLANEGKTIIIINPEIKEGALNYLKSHPLGKNSCLIGEIKEKAPAKLQGRVFIKNSYGGTRELGYLYGTQLPRIC